MKIKDIKFWHIRAFLNRYREIEKDSIFTKKGLWKIQKQCMTADLEVYWNYDDTLSDSQVEKILTEGIKGYYNVCTEIEELSWSWDIRDYYIRDFIENIDYDVDDLKDTFIEKMMKEYNCEREDVIFYAKEEILEFIRYNFEDDIDVDLNIRKLIRNTPGSVFIDNEEMMVYEMVDMTEVKANASDLLYAVIDFRNENLNNILGDIYEQYFPYRHLYYLDEREDFSVCIADSLDDYIDMLFEAEASGSNLSFVSEVNGKYFPLDNVPYLAREENFSSPCNGEAIIKTDDIELSDYYSNYDDFLDSFNEIINTYIKNYMEEKIANKDYLCTDKHGRTLLHYALLYGHADMLIDVLEGIWESREDFVFYETDRFGISPFAILTHIDEVNEVGDLFIERAYNGLFNKLPKYGETFNKWEIASKLKGTIRGHVYYIVESGRDFDNYDLSSTLIAFDVEEKEIVNLALKDFDVLSPCEPVKINLFGEIEVA